MDGGDGGEDGTVCGEMVLAVGYYYDCKWPHGADSR